MIKMEGSNRKLVKLNYSHCSPDIIRMIESQSMSWSGHVARMGENERGNSVLRETLQKEVFFFACVCFFLSSFLSFGFLLPFYLCSYTVLRIVSIY